jgi:hypothetical protein
MRSRIHGRLHEGPECDRGEDVDITIEIPAVHGYQQITRAAGKGIEMTCCARVTNVERDDLSTEII